MKMETPGATRSRGSEDVPVPSSEALLDAAVEQTFPASDPVAVTDAFRAAREREERAAAA